MFQTSESMRLSTPDELQPRSTKQWHTIKQSLPSCWFHIHYFDHCEGLENIIFTGEIDYLNQVISRSDISIQGVSLTSPPALNGEGCWLLSPLDQIHEYTTKQAEHEVLFGYEYKLLSGKTLVELWAEHLKTETSALKLVFSSPISCPKRVKCQSFKKLTSA